MTGISVKELVNQLGIDSDGYSGYSPLMISAWAEHIDIIQYLLQHDVDVSITNSYG
jgi:ankyrin repeat protein